MVPGNQFDRMAALALVAIIFSLAFACQAYAAEPGYIDSGPPPEQGSSLLAEVSAIRQILELLLYFVFPFTCAVILVYKFCMWFYHTFISRVL